jgi:hypothetical protein
MEQRCFLAGAGPGPAIFDTAQPGRTLCKFFTFAGIYYALR